ncbi:MAG TPA: Rieske 2Fe-2S domain-containing protein [Mycobacteriales bacterium]|jgi:ubiquinol-cytochrome c reductase iron-sulfur subunit|nr:Rieske 2Fe-2S domain-containing protein [Mycobacteriales bacterium]
MSEENGGTPPRKRVGRRPTDANNPATVERTSSQDVSEQQADSPEETRFAEIQVSALFLAGIAMLIFFTVAYFTISIHDALGQYSNYALGGSLALALFSIGGGFIVWAKKLLPHEKVVQDRHDFHSTEPERIAAENTLLAGVDDMGLGRFKILRRTLLGALGLFPIPLVIMLRDLGPLPHDSLRKSGWKRGDRLVDLDTKLPVKLGDLDIGGIKTVMPEGFTDVDEFALAPTMLIRFGPDEILSKREIAKGYKDHVAYSKICTHAGCPISLYERATHNLLCPCHQSTFDMARDAKVIFGPAARPLPQLAITVDDEGYFRALGDYSQPVGPSFWERR